ncbi:hypothetical protein WMY93_032327 [Mugilogobius chulae]|uniref:[Pyruvate dehydrogenase [acetyl-transferring]]-phosphatase 2, mitochondrial n=1 Tax=Mugilogobius chulae TaxID=88201 RepID=A0AAW0MP39_9GOBI
MFFIDWERPRNKSTTKATQAGGDIKLDPAPVSIWRTYFVANEWNEIQTIRKICPTFQNHGRCGLLKLGSQGPLTTAGAPPLAYTPEYSLILRYGVATALWLCIGLLQVIFFTLFYECVVEDKIRQFVDLCSISNISVMLLSHRCFGYYIHGRSVHGHADTNMEEMNTNLKERREASTCPSFGRFWKPFEQCTRAYNTMNHFLGAVIDHVSSPGLDYIVRDKLMLERVIGMEFLEPNDKSIFYNDEAHSFSSMLFYGNEATLLVFDTLFFCVVDLGSQSFVLAAILTYLQQMVYSNLTACQALGNMCVMNMHSFSGVSTDACGLFNTIIRSRAALSSTHDISYWKVNLPWLYYGEEPGLANRVLQTYPVPIGFSFRGKNEFTAINLLAAVYDVRGEFLKWVKIGPGNLQCTLSVKDLLVSHPEPVFFDIFMDLGGDENKKLLLCPHWSATNSIMESSLTKIPAGSSTQEGQFFPPLIAVTYEDVPITDIETQQVTTSFSVEYEMDQDESIRKMNVSSARGSGGGAVMYSVLKTVSWKRRIGSSLIDAETIFKFLLFYSEIWPTFSSLSLLERDSTGSYFTRPSNLFLCITLPTQEEQFVTYIGCAFALKGVQFFHKLVLQLSVDMFFIDWESPQQKQHQSHTSSQGPLTTAGAPPLAYTPEYSLILRYGVATALWLCIGLLQVIFFTLFYECVVEDKIRQFVDLCSISNISVMLLSHRCFGYYIHGRSVHGHADTNMEEMNTNLKREGESLCGQRGLLPNTDIQTFQISLTIPLRNQIDRIREPLNRRHRPARHLDASGNHFEQCTRAYNTMNHFLGAVIDHAHPGLDYIVRDKLMLERVIGMEFLEPNDKSIFYNDEAHSFSSMLFYGNEATLLVFDTLFFCVVDLGSQSFVLAAILTYLQQMVLRGLPRATALAPCLFPCQHQLAHFGPLSHKSPSRRALNSKSYRTSCEQRSYILTPPQVNSILKANEYSFKVPEFDGKNVSAVAGFESNQLPANAPIEDRRSAATCLQTRGMLLGVFDGHAGCACAQALSERLFYYIAVSLLPHDTLCELEAAVEAGRALSPILQWHKHPNDYFSREAQTLYFNSLRTYWQELIDLTNPGEVPDTREALLSAFKRLDNDISLEAQVGDSNAFLHYWVLRVAFSGATACVAHIDGPDLFIANSGDARAVLGVQEEDGTFSAHTLSNDHSAQNESEVARIRSEHPPSERKTVIRQDRLLGLLMPFRAFGDVKFKWSIELQKRVLESGPDQLHENEHTKFIPPNYHTPPYLTAEPEITYHRLRPQDRFLVIGSDGLWETLHRQEVVRIVGEYLTGVHQRQPLKVGGYKVTLDRCRGCWRSGRRACPPRLRTTTPPHT